VRAKAKLRRFRVSFVAVEEKGIITYYELLP